MTENKQNYLGLNVKSSIVSRKADLIQLAEDHFGATTDAPPFYRCVAYLINHCKRLTKGIMKMVEKKCPEASISISDNDVDWLPNVAYKLDSPGYILSRCRREEELENCEDGCKRKRFFSPLPATGISLIRSSTIPIRDIVINIKWDSTNLIEDVAECPAAYRVITDVDFLNTLWEDYSRRLSQAITQDEDNLLMSAGGSEVIDQIINGTHDDGDRKILGIFIVYNRAGSKEMYLLGSSDIRKDHIVPPTPDLEAILKKKRGAGAKFVNPDAKEPIYGLVGLPIYTNMNYMGYDFLRNKIHDFSTASRWHQNFIDMMLINETRTKIFIAVWQAIELILLHPKTEIKYALGKEAFPGPYANVNGKPTQAIKYIRKLELNLDDIVNRNNKEFLRKTSYWYVIGHYRHYKSGKTTWIDGYWKGALRELRDEIACPPREREIDPSDE